ncbi:MAG: hypothetical protein Q9162_006228 [Coniocarpon cinnabarinum]
MALQQPTLPYRVHNPTQFIGWVFIYGGRRIEVYVQGLTLPHDHVINRADPPWALLHWNVTRSMANELIRCTMHEKMPRNILLFEGATQRQEQVAEIVVRVNAQARPEPL